MVDDVVNLILGDAAIGEQLDAIHVAAILD
jgi:hypothetical protein